MDENQVQSQGGVTLIGGAKPSAETLEEALKFAPMLVAADGGADCALALGHRPDAVIGDFDSVSKQARAALSGATFIEIAEQETTDFEKCLRCIDAPLVIAAGFAEARVDHTLAVFSVLARRVGPPCVVLTETDAIFAPPSRISLDLDPGSRLSLFPMANVTGRSEGLEWPIDGLKLSPMGRVGTSNRVTGPVRLAFDAPGMLVITPRAALPRCLDALAG